MSRDQIIRGYLFQVVYLAITTVLVAWGYQTAGVVMLLIQVGLFLVSLGSVVNKK